MSELASRLSKEAQSGGPFDLRRAREEIIEKHRRATTTDERVLCLRLHQAVMDAVARQNVARENMEEFRKVRLQDYRALLLVPRVMYRPPRITVADLEETKRSFPKEFQENKSRLIFTLAGTIIRHFFGRDWVENNIIQDETYSRPPGFFRLDFSSDNERELKTFRTVDFAETLFNLQRIDGFDDRSTRCAPVRWKRPTPNLISRAFSTYTTSILDL